MSRDTEHGGTQGRPESELTLVAQETEHSHHIHTPLTKTTTDSSSSGSSRDASNLSKIQANTRSQHHTVSRGVFLSLSHSLSPFLTASCKHHHHYPPSRSSSFDLDSFCERGADAQWIVRERERKRENQITRKGKKGRRRRGEEGSEAKAKTPPPVCIPAAEGQAAS